MKQSGLSSKRADASTNRTRILEGGVEAEILRSDLDLELMAATIMGAIIGVHDLFETRWVSEELAQKLYRLHLAIVTAKEAC